MNNNLKNDVGINSTVFFGAVILCGIFYIPMLIFREELRPLGAQILTLITHSLDWAFLLLAFACLIFLLWLAFGRYGNVKLGGPDDKPEFSTFTWLSMLFAGGVGAGLVHWAVAEPMFYLMWPPFWAEPMSGQAAQWAIAYGVFHWGVLAWALYTPAAMAFAYMLYVRKVPYFYPSYACRGVLGGLVDTWVGRAIDIFVIVALVGGIGTTIGIVVPMIAAVIAHIIGIESTLFVEIGTLLALFLIIGYTVYTGIYDGIKKFAEINTWLVFILVGFILATGSTLWILSFYVDSMGVLIQNFFRMALYTDPITNSGFPQDWTVFYWAWFLAWSIYFGLFVARISKGRTIKNVVLNMAFTTTLGCSLFFMVLGGHVVDLQLNQGMALDAVLSAYGTGALLIAAMETLPLSAVVMPLFVVVLMIFQATAINTNAYSISMIASKKIKYGEEPVRWARLFWCILIVFIGIAILAVGGLQIVQLSSVATSLPILVITVILMISVIKWLNEDFGEIAGPKVLTADYKEEEEEKEEKEENQN